MRDLKKDLEICNKATPGIWRNTRDDEIPDDVRVCNIENGECICCLALMGNYNREKEEWEDDDIKQWNNDATFIAEARTGWPKAIERAINAEIELKQLRRIKNICLKRKQICDKWQSIDEENKSSEEFCSVIYDIKDLDRQLDKLLNEFIIS